MSELEALKHQQQPQTVASLTTDLLALGVKPGETLLVHSSLSAIGWVCGGAVAVIEALEAALGPEGTLMMPAHTSWNSEPAHWQNPPVPADWWPRIREEMPAWRSDTATTRGMGLIPETFRKRDGVRRSVHPQVSFIARGPQANRLLTNHELSPAFGENSPIGRLSELSGRILLLGVDHGSNTSLHLAELRAEHPQKRMKSDGAALLQNGRRCWIEFKDLDYDSDDFVDLGRDFMATNPQSLKRGRIGRADSQLFAQHDVLSYAVNWLKDRR